MSLTILIAWGAVVTAFLAWQVYRLTKTINGIKAQVAAISAAQSDAAQMAERVAGELRRGARITDHRFKL